MSAAVSHERVRDQLATLGLEAALISLDPVLARGQQDAKVAVEVLDALLGLPYRWRAARESGICQLGADRRVERARCDPCRPAPRWCSAGLSHAAPIQTPLMLLHGVGTQLPRSEASRIFADRLEMNYEPFVFRRTERELLRAPAGEHDADVQDIVAYFDQHLKGVGPGVMRSDHMAGAR